MTYQSPPPSSSAGIVVIRVLELVLALAGAALALAMIVSPGVMRFDPQTGHGLSLREVLGLLFVGVAGRPATMLSIAVATGLVLGAALAMAAWLAAGIVLVTGHALTGVVPVAGLLNGGQVLAWFGFASTWRLVAPWLVQGIDPDELPASADGTAAVVTGVDFGPLVWFALGLAVLWLLLDLLRRPRAVAVADGVLLLALFATAGALAAVPVVADGFGPFGDTVLSLLASLLFGGGWIGMAAWAAVGALAVQLALGAWIVARAPVTGRAPEVLAALAGVVAVIAAVVSLVGLNLAYHANTGTDGPLWAPYQPVTPVLAGALVLGVVALVLAARRGRSGPGERPGPLPAPAAMAGERS